MSTASNKTTTAQFSLYGRSIFWRFVWKEFRMIRSLWVAVAIMGLLVQCAERMLLPYSSEFPLTLLYTAFATAVLYAVGAAATTFSVEHEEETYDLLTRLPTTWWPPFAGKLLLTLVSALSLAGVLSIPALMTGNLNLTDQDARSALGMMGFVIIEAVAWGTLFSLLIKRPLLAAIVTLVVGAIMVNVAVTYSSTYAVASLTPTAYVHALPFRIAIVVAVFACSVLAGRSWLNVSARLGILIRSRHNGRLAAIVSDIFSHTRQLGAATVAESPRRRGMLARLLWQTWRECWKLLLAPLGVAGLLLAGIGAALGLSHAYGEVASFAMSATALFAPALYGAMVFYADQRRGNYRFLAEHAARPRYIWLARHIVWFGALFAVWLFLAVGLAPLTLLSQEFNSRQMFEYYLEWGLHPNASNIIYGFASGAEIAIRVVTATTFAALVAYSIGQFFSMAVRSEILAAFLALILTLVVGAWVFVICLWQLSATLFLLPIFAGLMLATWLRAPDWIAGRNSVHSWLKPVIAIIAPLVLIAVLLPSSRLAQIQSKLRNRNQIVAKENRDRDFSNQLAAFQAGDTTEAARTADMYMLAATRLMTVPSEDLLERWRKPEYLETSLHVVESAEIDTAKIPPNQQGAFKKAQKQQLERLKQRIATAVNEAIEISKRPTCRFHFDLDAFAPTNRNTPSGQQATQLKNPTYYNLNNLIGVVAGEPMSIPDQPARRFLAALKMNKHLRSGQPTSVVIKQLKSEQVILHRIDQWTLDPSRTKEELREVLDELSVKFVSPESPAESLLADHLLIRAVTEGKETPFILSTTPIAPHAYLAYLASGLWWERDRALQALERITKRNLHDAEEFINNIGGNNPQQLGVARLRHWLRPSWGGLPELWKIQEPAAVTSYLVSLEYQARVPISDLYRAYCDNEVSRRATLLQLALARYQHDHKKYPALLADLVPDYLHEVPLDPYSRQPFQYEPSGLSLPLRYWNLVGESPVVESGTPLIWSVGAGNFQLVEAADLFGESGDPPPDDQKSPPPETYYRFDTIELGWNNSHALAFPLAK